ncbi:MAG: thiolase family protein [Dethiobacter sp.]|jgi:acetyl-CoA acetyltransferase|nr:MAG: thiolase family protein [Dethiobacter sp.]
MEVDQVREVAIAGIGLAKFGRYDGKKGRPRKLYPELGGEAIAKALRYADMEWKEIEAAFGGTYYGGLGGTHQCVERVGLTGIPIVNVYSGHSSEAALRLAYTRVALGVHDVVLVVGAETLPPGLLDNQAMPAWMRMMGLDVLPAEAACTAVRYMEDYGATVDDFARVSVMERKSAKLNPNAMFQQEVTIEEVLRSRMISSPLNLLMTCANADGAAAVIVCSKDKLKSKNKTVAIASVVQTSATYGTSLSGGSVSVTTKVINPDCVELAAKQTWEASGYGPEDMDVIQIHDPFSPAFLWNVEKCGFCKRGEAPRLVKEGYFERGGKLPANTDGGIIGRGHPTAATGLVQIAEIFYQLREEAGPRQVAGAKVGFAQGGGAGPQAVLTVLKR